MAKARAKAESVATRNAVYTALERGDLPVPERSSAAATRWFPPGSVFAPPISPFQAHFSPVWAKAAQFYQLRMRKDFETLAGMTLCRTPQDAGALWLKAAQDAATDYAGMFGEIFGHTAKTGGDRDEGA